MWQDECDHEWVERESDGGSEPWLCCEHCNALCSQWLVALTQGTRAA